MITGGLFSEMRLDLPYYRVSHIFMSRIFSVPERSNTTMHILLHSVTSLRLAKNHSATLSFLTGVD